MTPRHLTEEEDNKRLRLYRMRKSDVSIAKECGVRSVTILSWRQRRGLSPNVPAPYQVHPFLMQRKIIRLYKRKVPVEDIAEQVGLSYKRVSIAIGHYLMKLCRSEPSCPMKALLPETDVAEEKTRL